MINSQEIAKRLAAASVPTQATPLRTQSALGLHALLPPFAKKIVHSLEEEHGPRMAAEFISAWFKYQYKKTVPVYGTNRDDLSEQYREFMAALNREFIANKVAPINGGSSTGVMGLSTLTYMSQSINRIALKPILITLGFSSNNTSNAQPKFSEIPNGREVEEKTISIGPIERLSLRTETTMAIGLQAASVIFGGSTGTLEEIGEMLVNVVSSRSIHGAYEDRTPPKVYLIDPILENTEGRNLYGPFCEYLANLGDKFDDQKREYLLRNIILVQAGKTFEFDFNKRQFVETSSHGWQNSPEIVAKKITQQINADTIELRKQEKQRMNVVINKNKWILLPLINFKKLFHPIKDSAPPLENLSKLVPIYEAIAPVADPVPGKSSEDLVHVALVVNGKIHGRIKQNLHSTHGTNACGEQSLLEALTEPITGNCEMVLIWDDKKFRKLPASVLKNISHPDNRYLLTPPCGGCLDLIAEKIQSGLLPADLTIVISDINIEKGYRIKFSELYPNIKNLAATQKQFEDLTNFNTYEQSIIKKLSDGSDPGMYVDASGTISHAKGRRPYLSLKSNVPGITAQIKSIVLVFQKKFASLNPWDQISGLDRQLLIDGCQNGEIDPNCKLFFNDEESKLSYCLVRDVLPFYRGPLFKGKYKEVQTAASGLRVH